MEERATFTESELKRRNEQSTPGYLSTFEEVKEGVVQKNSMTISTIDHHIKEIYGEVATLREKKGKSGETLQLLDSVLESAQDLVVNLMLERHLLYQHIVMEEDAKNKSKRNKDRRRIGAKNMGLVAIEVFNYVKTNNLNRWFSRVNRCLGRVADYKGEYKKAIGCYKKAIKYAKHDPEVVKEIVPRELEYNAFLAHSTMMSGQVDKGFKFAKDTYKEFDRRDGMKLKKKDYPTWAIWKSGIPIRMINGLIKLGEGFDRKEMVEWLDNAEKLLTIPKGSKKWLGKVDFGFRKDEIKAVRRKLREI